MGRQGLSPEAVVDAALAVIDDGGAEALTLANVARRVGVRTPSLYNHVEGLDDLRNRVTARVVADLGEHLQQAAVGLAGRDAVVALTDAFREVALRAPARYSFTVATTEHADDRVRDAGRRTTDTVLRVLAGLGLHDDEAIHAARLLRSAVHGFVDLETRGGFGLDVDVDASFLMLQDSLVNALTAHPVR